MQADSTVEEILQSVERFRILCVGRAGVGKSSLINRVFGLTREVQRAEVSHFTPGHADIDQEFTSDENRLFVLHDSKGFEPGDFENFKIVHDFIQRRNSEQVLKDRVHAIWLCTDTPTAGGRVFEKGDEKLLQLANEVGIPTVVVFTQYDRLVRSKKFELEDDEEGISPQALHQQGEEAAKEAFKICSQSLENTGRHLNVMPLYHVAVSTRLEYQDRIAHLVNVTRDIVRDRLAGDAWLLWATAQRASLSVKIDACVERGMNRYYRAIASGALHEILLRECLVQVHQDIVKCWNFKDTDEILTSNEFNHLMLYLIQDVHDKSSHTSPPDVDRISQFVTLVTAASTSIAPPVAILGLTYFFIKWLSNATLGNLAMTERVIMTYTVDLISVLKSLFYVALQPSLSGAPDWNALKESFEAFERSDSRQRIHESCRSKFPLNSQGLRQAFDRNSFRKKLKELLEQA